jgi:AhpC/TSA family
VAVKPRTRKRLRTAAVAFLGVLVVLGGLAYFSIHRAIATRGPGEVQGGSATDFSLPDTAGKTVTLAELTAHGPAVLVFYRGYW